MSRIANKPIPLPHLVSLDINDHQLVVKSSKGVLTLSGHSQVLVKIDEDFILKRHKEISDYLINHFGI